MAEGYFLIEEDETNVDLKFFPDQNKDGEIPVEQQDLVTEISGVLNDLKILYKGRQDELNKRFKELAGIARIGVLSGDIKIQPKMSKRSLSQLKLEILQKESGRIKNSYMKELGIKALLIALVLLLLYLILQFAPICWNTVIFQNFLLLVVGTVTGVWLSYGIRKKELDFEDLIIIEKDRLEPLLRLIFTALIAVIFGLLFLVEFVSIDIGKFSTKNLDTSGLTALVLGCLLGLSENVIGLKLGNKASSFLDNF